MKKILLTGKEGQVGWELQRTLAPLGQVIAFDRHSLDLANGALLVQTIRDIKPALIVNAAAYTAVDKAESEPELAFAINGVAPGILAEEAKRLHVPLIHYSTDYVFNGRSKTPYDENDQTAPLNVYGQSKLAGEQAIQAVSGSHLILRTSWVYGARGKNFLLTMLRLAAEREALKIVGDQQGAPTWSRLIAQATAQIAALGNRDLGLYNGIYHLAAAGKTNWCEFAEAIFKHYVKEGVRIPQLTRIATEEYPLPAQRPRYSVLAQDKVQNAFGVKMPDWEDALKLCLQELR